MLPISCITCFPARQNIAQIPASSPQSKPDYFEPSFCPRRPNSEPHSRNPSFSRRSYGLPTSNRSALDPHQLQQSRQYTPLPTSSNLPSPLESPTSPTHLFDRYSASLGSSEASARYSSLGTGTVPTDTCPNCSLSIPKSISEKIPDGAPGSPTKDGRGKNGSPVLRTRESFIAGANAEDLPEFDEKHGADWKVGSERSDVGKRTRQQSTSRISIKDDYMPSSSASSDGPHSCSSSVHGPGMSRSSTFATSYPTTPPSTPPTHAHTLTYLTTRQPASLDAHALLRRSCIRALSCEQLPRTHSGPLFFGDDETGYTISFVFRLSDACARGRVRRYAFIAWAGREERRAARAYKEVLHVFAGMASRIVDMVDKREELVRGDGGGGGGGGPDGKTCTPVSSFLSGRGVDPDGQPRTRQVRAKGLAELVGKEDFFVEVHAVFVQLLAQLGRGLGGLPMANTVVDSGIQGEVGEVGLEEKKTTGQGAEGGKKKARAAAKETKLEADSSAGVEVVHFPVQTEDAEVGLGLGVRAASPFERTSRQQVVI